MRNLRRGVAQVEFVAGFPLLLAMFGLAVLAGAMVLALAHRSATKSGRAGDGSPSGEVQFSARSGVASTGSASQARPALQVPTRFGVVGGEKAVDRLRPIAALGGKPIETPEP